jgi:hypothetical protein
MDYRASVLKNKNLTKRNKRVAIALQILNKMEDKILEMKVIEYKDSRNDPN